MTNNPVEVSFSEEARKNRKQLRKKYTNFDDDIRPVLEQLQNGETPGDQIPGVGLTVYKARVRNSDARKGKRGGYRFIYYLKVATHILVVTIYSKSDQDDISLEVIRRIIEDYEQNAD